MDDSKLLQDKLDRVADKMESRLANIESKMSDMAVQMAVYNAELNRHIEGVALARKENEQLRAKYNTEIPPLQDFKSRVLWGLVVVGGLIGGIITIVQFILDVKSSL